MSGAAQPAIGLLGGLGVGAAIHYYRELAAAHDDVRRPMNLVMVHASISRATNYAAQGDRKGLAAYLASFLERLKAAVKPPPHTASASSRWPTRCRDVTVSRQSSWPEPISR